jgi:hypothetical protein
MPAACEKAVSFGAASTPGDERPITATAGDGWLRVATAGDVVVFRLEASNG